ncbi:MAG: hypothetical protein JJV95_00915 [Sulfurospirillum sp.]|nr:hypothetical protein [Sulfurospirillum sp.]MBL0702529.1 hypothetical protein [Sulfurospirillum sp.]
MKTTKIPIKISLSYDILACLNDYFKETASVIREYEAEFQEEETLNFSLMKRFLNTAYYNLRDIDSSFMDQYILELREILKILENVYDEFNRRNIPEIAFDKIFLNKQVEYQQYESKKTINASNLQALQLVMKSLEVKKKNIQKMKNSGTNIEEAELEERKYNKFYVDTVHGLSSLKDENIKLINLIEKFKEKYIDEFIAIYQDKTKEYNQFIRQQLDGYAYEFDKKMWEAAETSFSIRNFFQKANIEEDYSSKTFLKYFIKGLDENKFSQEHKRLHTLLEYLENKAKVRVLIASENKNNSNYIKHIIRSFDKNYSVEVISQPRSIYYRKDLDKIDIIFADFFMKNPTIYKFISMVQKRFVQTNSSTFLCVTSTLFKKHNLVELQEKEINSLLLTSETNKKLKSQLKELINSLHA